jgi:hypothetical protein
MEMNPPDDPQPANESECEPDLGQPERPPWVWTAAIIGISCVGIAILIGLGSMLNRNRSKSRLPSVGKVAHEPPIPLSPDQRIAAQKFAKELARNLAEGNSTWLFRHSDVQGYRERLMAGLPKIGKLSAGFDSRFGTQQGNPFNQFSHSTPYFLHLRERDGFAALTFRLQRPDGGFTYCDLMVRPEGNTFRIVDAYLPVIGTTMSEEFLETTLDVIGVTRKTARELVGDPMVDARRARQLLPYLQRVQALEWPEVLKAHQALPPGLRRLPFVHNGYLHALKALSREDPSFDAPFRKAIADAPAILGPNALVEIFALDLHLFRNDHAAAIRSLDAIINAIGDDAFLFCARGRLHLRTGNRALAEADLQRARGIQPDFEGLPALELDLIITSKRHREAVAAMDRFNQENREAGIQLTTDDFDDDLYTSFRASPEFREWSRRNPPAP